MQEQILRCANCLKPVPLLDGKHGTKMIPPERVMRNGLCVCSEQCAEEWFQKDQVLLTSPNGNFWKNERHIHTLPLEELKDIKQRYAELEKDIRSKMVSAFMEKVTHSE